MKYDVIFIKGSWGPGLLHNRGKMDPSVSQTLSLSLYPHLDDFFLFPEIEKCNCKLYYSILLFNPDQTTHILKLYSLYHISKRKRASI